LNWEEAQVRIDYNLNDKFDLWLFFSMLGLMVFGLVAIYSSTVHHPTAFGNFNKQLIAAGISLVLFFTLYSIPTSYFKDTSIYVFLFSIFLLLLVLVIGRKVSGARSWIAFGGFGFQPSEFAKIATIFMLSSFLSKASTNIDSILNIGKFIAIGLIPVGLILIEPDLGSSFVFFAVMLMLLFWKGISLFGLYVVLAPPLVAIAALFGTYYFIGALVIVLALLFFFKPDIISSVSIFAVNLASGFFVDYVYKALSEHQQTRIRSFIDPNADPLGAGYNSIQAKVAIGSGGLFGKGFLHGNQTQLQFIPEQWTDFIFCVIGEEFGFIGSLIILTLFIILFLRIMKIATTTKDEFLSMVIAGIFTVYMTHFIINIGMTIGLMPVIGIPLPFVSYGGSSLLINMGMLGIVANVYRTRKNYT
jgi:rod shape determining protein RodA